MIGLGGIGQRHVRNLRSLLGDDVEFTAYRVRRNTPVLSDSLAIVASENLEETYRIRVVATLDAALAERPDVALICNPSSLHVPVATAAAKAGCHLFIEKPLAHRWDGVEALIDIVDNAGSVALVGFQWRFHPLLARVKHHLSEASVGRILTVRAEVGEYLPGWHAYEDYRRMYASRSELGGGVILSQIHEMDYLYWLFGSANRVFAMGGKRSSLAIDVEDTASILMDFDGLPVNLQLDYLQRPPHRSLKIVGDAGTIFADLLAPRLSVYRHGELIEKIDYEGYARNDMFLSEMQHFLKCLSREVEPVVSLRDGARSLAMALAAKRSLESGQVVALP